MKPLSKEEIETTLANIAARRGCKIGGQNVFEAGVINAEWEPLALNVNVRITGPTLDHVEGAVWSVLETIANGRKTQIIFPPEFKQDSAQPINPPWEGYTKFIAFHVAGKWETGKQAIDGTLYEKGLVERPAPFAPTPFATPFAPIMPVVPPIIVDDPMTAAESDARTRMWLAQQEEVWRGQRAAEEAWRRREVERLKRQDEEQIRRYSEAKLRFQREFEQSQAIAAEIAVRRLWPQQGKGS